VFGWGWAEFYRTNRMAVEAAFVDEAVKAGLRQRIGAHFASGGDGG